MAENVKVIGGCDGAMSYGGKKTHMMTVTPPKTVTAGKGMKKGAYKK